MLAIYKKELRSYFTSMTGYVFMAFFLVILGIYYAVYNLINHYANFEYTLSGVSFIFVLLVPILTMRIMAEEKKQKTDQLLFTSPITITKIILGKFFGVFTVFLIVIGIVCLYPLIMLQFGSVPLASGFNSILGFALLGGAYIAIGLFISAMTESQVVAAVVSFIVMLVTALMDSLVDMLPSDKTAAWLIFAAIILLLTWVTYVMMHNITISVIFGVAAEIALTVVYMVKPTVFDGSLVNVFSWFSVIQRYDNFTNGLLDLTGIVYFISIIILFLFLTVQAIKKSRWN